MEALESRQLLSITLPAGTSIFVPLNGNSSGNAANFAVTVSDYSMLTPVLMPQTNKSLQLNVNINGVSQPMVFQLLDNLAPNTAAYIEALAQSGFYDGLSIYRNGKDQAGNPFVIQGGNDPPTGPIKTDQSSIAEEFNPGLQFTSAGILAMARSSTPSSSSTEFFVTEQPARFLDYSYTIFGIQTVGSGVIQTIQAMPDEDSTQDTNGVGYLATPLTITSASIFTDTKNGVLELSAPAGVTGTVTVTVTTSDGTNTPTTQSFTVTIQADSASNPADPFASATPSAPTSVTYVPPAGATGNQITNLNNSAANKELQFQVSGVTSGNVVEVLADGAPIGQATASDTSVVVTTDGSTDLTDGLHTITAIQIAKNQTVSITESGSSTAANFTADIPSLNTSTAVQLTVDTVAPQLDFTPATTAVVGVPYFCNAAVSQGSTSGITYQLSQSPTGMSIDANTGMITWTPAAGQQSPAQVTVRATDAADNTGQQQYAINVLASNASPILTAANPSLGTTDNDTTATIHLATFINNGSGTTLIADTDDNAVIGGIALVGATGNGTWQYSLDGTTFIAVGAVSESSSLLLANNAVLRYIPDGKSAETSSITYRAWDATGGANGVRADLSQAGAVGGSTAFSTNTDTAKLVITAGSLSGYVYFDSNDDGLMTGSETGLAGVTVRIYSQNSDGTWTEASGVSPVQTNAAGLYSFKGLATGVYQIKVSPSSEVLVGQSTVGTVAGTTRGTAGNGMFQIQLGASENGSDYNFGILGLQPALLSLRMFLASTPPMTQVIQNMHAAPEVSLSGAGGTSGYNTTYDTQTTPVAIASSGASISSPDSSTLTSMTVTIENLQDGSAEQLQADTSGTSITSSYADGVLALSGVADVSTYQEVLGKVKYSDTSSSAVLATRTVSVVVNDGTFSSAAATSSLTLIKGTDPSGYSIKANQNTLNSTTATSAGFTFANAEVGATYAYTISSGGGGTPVTGSGAVTSATQDVAGIDVSSLTDGTLTFSVTLTNGVGTGEPASATETLDRVAPSGYSVTSDQLALNATAANSAGFTFAGAEVGATYSYTISSSGGGTPITGSGIITSATQDVTGINVSSLMDGTLIYYVTLTDLAGNVGASAIASTILDRVSPTGYSITADQATLDNTTAALASFTFSNAELDAKYTYTVTSSGGQGSVTGNGTISSSTQQVTGINVAMLPNGTLNFSVTLTDAAGNIGSAATAATATLTQTTPAGYTITADQSALNSTTATSAGFTFAGAEAGATYTYTISSGGGGTPVTGSGTVASATQDVTGINVSSLPDGTLTFSVTLANGTGTGEPTTAATTTLNQTAPSGYSITANQTVLNSTTASSAGFTFAGAEAGAIYAYTITSSGGGTPVTGSGTVSSADQNVTGIDVSSLPDGTLTFNVKLTNSYGNTGNAATATASLDGTPPSGYSITADQTSLTAATATAAGFSFTGAEVGATYAYTISSDGGGTPVVGSGTVKSAVQDVTGINVSSLLNGTLTFSVNLTDLAGNIGATVTATTTLGQ
jgi:cyclophilin family peptidyl-prolyl cis-trans isomerase